MRSDPDPVNLCTEFDQLFSEVIQLRVELIPLHRQFTELVAISLEIEHKPFISNKNVQTQHEDSVRRKFRSSSESLKNVIPSSERKSQNFESFERALLRHIRKIRALQLQLREDDAVLLITRCRIDEQKMPVICEEAEKQKREINRLQVEIEDQIQIMEELKTEIDELQKPMPAPPPPELIDYLECVMKLKNRKEEKLTKLIREQEEEIFERHLKDHRKIKGLTSLFVGWFGPTVEGQEITVLFEDPQKIQSIVMTEREHRGEVKRCAYVNFDCHETAKKAIDGMQGFGYGGHRLMFIWNDEQMPSSSESSDRGYKSQRHVVVVNSDLVGGDSNPSQGNFE
jgi:RNA recognition motif-containing protein